VRLWRRHWPIIAILAVFLALGAAYSVLNPLFESPDEVWHYEYVRWLVEGHGLPTPQEVGSAPWRQEGSQPPLYYLAAALLTSPIPTDNAAAVIRYNPHAAVGQPDSFGNKNVITHGSADAWPWQGVALAAHLARLFSLLLGAVTVLSAYGTATAVLPERRAVAALSAALVAFNPQFLFISASVNNDNLVIAASAAGVWLAVYLIGKYGRRPGDGMRAADGDTSRPAWDPDGPAAWQLGLLGVLAGIAALGKLSGLALAGLAGLALMITAWRRATPFRTLLIWGLITGGAMLVTAGWWYGRNLVLYHDPLGLQAMFDILPQRATRPSPAELLARGQGVWRSAWAVFGWFNVAVGTWLYTVYTGLCLLGLAGLLVAWPARRLLRRKDDREAAGAGSRTSGHELGSPARRLIQLALLAVWVIVVVLALVTWAQMRYPQGRLLFPAISAAAVLIALGLLGWLPRRLHSAATGLIATSLAVLAILAVGRWIVPAYAAPQLLPSTAEAPGGLQADFGGQVRLAGYKLEQAQAQPGDTVYLTLYWQALQHPKRDYSVFIHLLDENDLTQAQNDSYPAAGSLPTSEWPLGQLIPDRHAVQIPATAPAPGKFKINVGVYDYATGQRLPVNGQDQVTLGSLDLTPLTSADGIPNPQHINFGDQIALVGFDMNSRTLRPGETLDLTLWWEALTKSKQDYKAFTHLVLPPGTVWAGMDKDLRGPSSHWQPGQPVEEHYRLSLPKDAPGGAYFIEIGLYDPKTGGRLMVNGSDKGIPLGYVSVKPDAALN
jgi:hypothetical protein